MIATTINKVDISIFAKVDGLKALCIENGLLHLLHIKVIHMPLQAHQHYQPVFIIIARMKRPLNVCDWHFCLVSLPST